MTRGPMMTARTSPLVDSNMPKNRVQVTGGSERQGAKLVTKGSFGRKTTYVQLPENMIKPSDQNYKSTYYNDYQRKHSTKPVKKLKKSYTTSIKKFAEDGISKVALPDHSIPDQYNTQALGMPYNESQAQAINRLQRAMRTLSTEDRARMGMDGKPTSARGHVTTPYEAMEASDLLTGRPSTQPASSRQTERQARAIKTIPTTSHAPPSRQGKQHPTNDGTAPASEQLPKAADKVAKEIAREYDACKRERGWIYGQAGRKAPIGHVSAKKQMEKDLENQGDSLPGFKEWLTLANEYEKYVVHDFAEHMARNLHEEEGEYPAIGTSPREYPRPGSALCEEDLSDEQLISFRQFVEEKRRASEEERAASVIQDFQRPRSAAPAGIPLGDAMHEPAAVDGQRTGGGKSVRIISPAPPSQRTPSPPKSARRVRSADLPPSPRDELSHARARSVDGVLNNSTSAYTQEQSAQVPPPFRGGPMFRDPVTQSVPSLRPQRESYKHCCSNCGSCMKKKVDEMTSQLQGMKPFSHEDIVRNHYLPDGITLSNVYPNLNGNEHTDTLTELVKHRRKVGGKGHFVIHPQFCSENGGKKITSHTKSQVMDFTKFFK